MNELEDKIKEYLKSIPYGQQVSKSAKNIAEIANLYWEDKINEHQINKLYEQNDELKDENTSLKQQLKAVKYLDREEVEKIINPHRKSDIFGEHYDLSANDITAICNLAIEPITKDGIIKVLNKYAIELIDTSSNPVSAKRVYPKAIVNEILNNNDKEE